MANLSGAYNGQFSVNIAKPAIFMFTVQSAARETVAFYKDGSNTPVVFKDDQGTVMGNPQRGALEPGNYVVKISTTTGYQTKIRVGKWNVQPSGATNVMTMVSAAVEDATDNDYNDVFLQIFWWKYQN